MLQTIRLEFAGVFPLENGPPDAPGATRGRVTELKAIIQLAQERIVIVFIFKTRTAILAWTGRLEKISFSRSGCLGRNLRVPPK
jgi:hypothetical protein